MFEKHLDETAFRAVGFSGRTPVRHNIRDRRIGMLATRRPKFTLMPLIALALLSVSVSVPIFSATAVHAAPTVRYATVVVRPGDNVWSLAESRTPSGTDVTGVVDEIVAINHIGSAGIHPGERIRIPQ